TFLCKSIGSSMRWLKLSLVLICSFAAHGEEQKQPEGNGVMITYGKEQKEFYDKTSRLNSLSTRMEEDEKQFMIQVRAKAAEKDPKEKQRILKQMVFFSDDRNKSADEFNKIKTELGLRYPNQGEHLNRQYRTQVKKTVQEMEGAAGLDELLTRTKKIVDKK